MQQLFYLFFQLGMLFFSSTDLSDFFHILAWTLSEYYRLNMDIFGISQTKQPLTVDYSWKLFYTVSFQTQDIYIYYLFIMLWILSEYPRLNNH